MEVEIVYNLIKKMKNEKNKREKINQDIAGRRKVGGMNVFKDNRSITYRSKEVEAYDRLKKLNMDTNIFKGNKRRKRERNRRRNNIWNRNIEYKYRHFNRDKEIIKKRRRRRRKREKQTKWNN